MRPFRFISVCSSLAIVAGCGAGEAAGPTATPAAITLVAGAAQSAAAGQQVPIAPTFQVTDAHGAAIANVPVTITTSDGVLTDAPTRTANGATSVGTWTLGQRAGVDSLTVSVRGVAPLVVTATSMAGAPAKFATSAPLTVNTTVGEIVPSFTARVTDAFGNGVPATVVSVKVSGGSTSAATLTSDVNGDVAVPAWQLGTVAGQNLLTLGAGQASVTIVANLAAGDPAQLVVTGADQKGRAGAPVTPIVVRAADTYGNATAAQPATFTVTSGGGTLAAPSATPGADGSIVMPAWTLGRTTLPQTVHVVSGALATDVNVAVASDYKIDVRFFGPAMTDAQRALFTNAAARIQAIVTGDIPDIAVTNLDVGIACGTPGLPTLTETIDDLVIYASVQPIDGAGKVLAESGPCVFRNSLQGGLSAVGLMLFDSADLDLMSQKGILQDVITHEMLHVVGIGTLWSDKNLIAAAGTPNVAYYGAQGRQGCVADAGASVCASSVPVENNGVIGTADSHWRESTFGTELMTGYVNYGPMPLSAITVGSLADLGYTVNPFAADPYTVPTGVNADLIPATGGASPWERLPPSAVILGPSPGAAPTFIRRR